MIYYILTAVVTGFIVFALSTGINDWWWKMRIQARSSLGKSLKIDEYEFFFMTQDQIQKAALSINKLEAEYKKDVGRDWYIPESELN